MLSNYQQQLLGDVAAPEGYGTPIAGWKGQQPLFNHDPGSASAVPLPFDLALTFVDGFYILCRTKRGISIYRGYETAGLEAPFGREHPSFIRNLISHRRPGIPDGSWWTPTRPAKSIDHLRLPSMFRAEDRTSSAIKREWNRLDFYLEGFLPAGSLVYVGRTAPQQESAAYGGKKLGGGGFQFRLTKSPEQALFWVKRHMAA